MSAMTVEEVRTKAELRELVEDYATLTDAFDNTSWAELFSADATFTAVNPGEAQPYLSVKGHDELLGVLARNERFRRTFHLIGNHRCTIDGDSARGVVYCLAHHLMDVDPPRSYIMLIRYNDVYAHTLDGWKFASRRLEFAWNEIHEVDPARLDAGAGGIVELAG
jgi:3-phenylpropionate/cinnamic acid dioxygenase small subunit